MRDVKEKLFACAVGPPNAQQTKARRGESMSPFVGDVV
jgi:hypothetical protein